MDIPTGWKKGSALHIEKKVVHGKPIIVLSEPFDFSLDPGGSRDANHVANVHFYDWKEAYAFLQFWF